MADTVDGAARILWTRAQHIYQPWTINLWQTIAERYANEPAVAGYDLLDEPLLSESNSASGGSTVRAFYVTLTNAIRSVDTNHILFACGTDWCGSVAGVQAILPPWDSNMVLVLHDYDNPIDTSVISEMAASAANTTFPSGTANQVRVQIPGLPAWSARWNPTISAGAGGPSRKSTARLALVWAMEVTPLSPMTISEPANYGDVLNYVQNFGTGTSTDLASDCIYDFSFSGCQCSHHKLTYNSGIVTSLTGKSPAIFSLSGCQPVRANCCQAGSKRKHITATISPIP